jgi:hypothetical protein
LNNIKARPDFAKDKRRRGQTSPLRREEAELEPYGGLKEGEEAEFHHLE